MDRLNYVKKLNYLKELL